MSIAEKRFGKRGNRNAVVSCIGAALFLFTSCMNGFAADLYAAVDGKDSGMGTLNDPYATLERARDQVRYFGVYRMALPARRFICAAAPIRYPRRLR